MRPPAGLPAGACRGSVTVRYRAGRRTISARRARVNRSCRFTSRVTFTLPARFAGRRALRVSARYNGSPYLRPANATRTRTVRVR